MLLEAGDSQWWPPWRERPKGKEDYCMLLSDVVIRSTRKFTEILQVSDTPRGWSSWTKSFIWLGLAIKLTGLTSSNAVSVVLHCCYTNPCVASLGNRRYFVHLDGTWRAATEPGPDEVSSRTAWCEGCFLSGVLHSCPHKIFIKSNFFSTWIKNVQCNFKLYIQASLRTVTSSKI